MGSSGPRGGWWGRGWGWGCFRRRRLRWASLAAAAVYWLLPVGGDSAAFWGLVVASLAVGPWACGTLVSAEDPDPKRAVWDEVAGMWLTCLFLPKTLVWLAVAFLVFRALDVLKPWPIRRFEGLPGGWGIMADDVAAGVVGAAALNAVYRLGCSV